MSGEITGTRKAEIIAAVREYDEQHRGHLAANDGAYPFCGCNPYQDVIYSLPEFDPEDPRNLAVPEQENRYILNDGTVIEERHDGTGWDILPGANSSKEGQR
jgi:hypothetical protein